MNGTTRVVARAIRVIGAIGVIAPLAHAAAESSAEQRTRCEAYADRAVAQYHEAAAHPQCKVSVDLVWQPSRDYHFGACMNASRTVAEQTTAGRDRTLQACASAPGAGASILPPHELAQCERSILKVCGTWTLSNGLYAASWSNGAKGSVSVASYDGHSIALHRVDPPDSVTPGLTADYTGNVDGGKMKGKVTFTWPGHVPPVGYGTWEATFTPAPPELAATAPAAPAQSAASAAGCVAPVVPESWTSPSHKRSEARLWKVENGVLSYTDPDRKQVSFRVSRPKIWQDWLACARKDAVPAATYTGGLWIWISDNRSDAKVFNLQPDGGHFSGDVVSMPASVVLAEEARP